MNITRNVFTISDLNNWMDQKELNINRDYQRSPVLWPINARSFFIDTILNNFPFPKILIRQTIDLKTKKSIREIIDGQQRMMAINDFIHDRLILTKVSERYKGQKFSDLDEDIKKHFLAYEVSVDTIIGSEPDTIFEIFRRLNSYTVPLNEAEKRHATFQGEFKWLIVDLANKYDPLFELFNILSTKTISRMGDAELLSELFQIIDIGIESKSNSKIEKLYKEYDDRFERKEDFKEKIIQTMDFIKVELYPVCEAKVLKQYSFYSLFGALIYNKWGIQNLNLGDLSPIDQYCVDVNIAIQNILELFNSLFQDDTNGRFSEFIASGTKATNNKGNRITRIKWMVKALQNQF